MKTTFAALALSLFSTTIAVPTPQTINPYPVSVANLSLKHLIESNTYDFTLDVTTRTTTGEGTDTINCHTAWNHGGPYPNISNAGECEYIYSFYFPEGAANVESYQLAVRGPHGEASTLISTGPRYQCGPYEGDIGNIDTECRSINGGEFYLAV
ncbi:hypothetical protein BDW59DRAFT_72904 [Aspergillus cavernicola]|uniref:AA1-like domain-containing protein n=1 Tax=Aspergillus cavernicola TaxID=176166 RepID=A0ABR4ICJ1_9EURO